jgi:hypothetical protein
MAKFRKEIEAIQWTGTNESFKQVQEFYPKIIDGGFVGAVDNENGKDSWPLFIKTLEGAMCADINDWIVKDENGEFFTCKSESLENL